LRWLQSQPFVAPDKIVLGGWSNGAMAMLWTVFTGAPYRPKSFNHDFRAAFDFYSGCSTLQKREQRYTAAVPTLLQLGTDDNWTLSEPCRELVETVNTESGARMTTESYEGAVHSFDHPTSKPRTISIISGRRVRIGSDPVARHKAIDQIRRFLRSVFTA
jgi:dienelactone hydrolase